MTVTCGRIPFCAEQGGQTGRTRIFQGRIREAKRRDGDRPDGNVARNHDGSTSRPALPARPEGTSSPNRFPKECLDEDAAAEPLGSRWSGRTSLQVGPSAPGARGHRPFVAVLHARAANLGADHKTRRVGQDTPLAALDPFPGVEAAGGAAFGGFHARVVELRRGAGLAPLEVPRRHDPQVVGRGFARRGRDVAQFRHVNASPPATRRIDASCHDDLAPGSAGIRALGPHRSAGHRVKQDVEMV